MIIKYRTVYSSTVINEDYIGPRFVSKGGSAEFCPQHFARDADFVHMNNDVRSFGMILVKLVSMDPPHNRRIGQSSMPTSVERLRPKRAQPYDIANRDHGASTYSTVHAWWRTCNNNNHHYRSYFCFSHTA